VKSILVACASGVALLTFGMGTASAGQPAVQGCFGASVSANAGLPGPYGQFVSGIAPRNGLGSVGEAVQAVQAGLIPDQVYPNSCHP
jgi:hypothetical protein